METARRLRYLQALGVEPWRRRVAAPAAHAAAVAEPSPVPAAEPSVPVSMDWQGLQGAVAACRKCRLCETRTNTVFGVGPRGAPLMVVGEGPGADEDARGEPFVGRAGKLLDEMLRAIGRSRERDTFIANVVKCRPPGNREPAEDEAEHCRPFLEQQLRLVRPKLIVALGRVAAQRLLATDTPIGKMRGQSYTWGPDATPLMVTYHPAYLLRNPGDKAKSWEDLKRIHRFLAGT
jgi:uracil-DNA glycosylase family 4